MSGCWISWWCSASLVQASITVVMTTKALHDGRPKGLKFSSDKDFFSSSLCSLVLRQLFSLQLEKPQTNIACFVAPQSRASTSANAEEEEHTAEQSPQSSH